MLFSYMYNVAEVMGFIAHSTPALAVLNGRRLSG